jgi:hypothetical protein
MIVEPSQRKTSLECGSGISYFEQPESFIAAYDAFWERTAGDRRWLNGWNDRCIQGWLHAIAGAKVREDVRRSSDTLLCLNMIKVEAKLA